MVKIRFHNTLTRSKEQFKPIRKNQVGIYSCGPTVYNYAHIGNLRTYIFNDILKKSLEYLGFNVTHVMNITDVDDKTIKASIEEKTPLQKFTRKYESIFLSDLSELNISKPTKILRATESIQEMIKIINSLLKREYAYKTSDGIYFSIDKSKNYGRLANLENIKKSKSRISSDEYKKNSTQDFALWKFHTKEDGENFWEAPFGKGRPGWHIECSAMSMKVLGKTLDIHTGANDLIFPHHTNEIAQSEAHTGKKFVNYWLHAGFLNMEEGKMSKSLGNILTLKDLKNQGFSPIDFRYLTLQTHYRKPLVFSINNLEAAKSALENIKRRVILIKSQKHKGKDLTDSYNKQFEEALSDDLNTPRALAIFQKALDDFNFSPKKKLSLLNKFDSVLSLGIKDFKETKETIPSEIKKIAKERETLRKNKKFAEADILRSRIAELGFEVKDTSSGTEITKI